MKIYYAKRFTYASFHIHAGSVADMFYIPQMNIAIGQETIGTFGSSSMFLTDVDYILKEGECLKLGQIPETEGCSFKNIKEFEWNDWEITDLVEKLKQYKKLKTETEETIKKLLEDNELEEV